MTEGPEDPNLLNPLGQGSLPLGVDKSLEAEEKAMQSGKGKIMAVMLLALAIPIIGFVAYLALGDANEPYRTLGKNINGLRQTHFDPFWACSLTGAPMSRINNNEDLAFQLHRRGTRRSAYAAHVRDDCMTDLDQLEPALELLIAPDDMREQVRELSDAVGTLRGAWSGYIAYLDGLGDAGYDEDDGAPHVRAITRGWYDYRRIHADLNGAIRTKLDE